MTPFRLLTAFAMLAPAAARAQERRPLDHLVAEGLRNNRTLAIERIAERQSAAEVRAARGMFFPSLTVNSRSSEQSGTLDLGDFLNPAYAALNELSGRNDFPTAVSMTLPLAHETRLRLVQPVFNETIRSNHRVARQRSIGQHEHRKAAERRYAAQVQIAYVSWASARSEANVYEATLDLVKEHERVTGRLLEAGTATPDALYRARADRSDVEQRLAEARERVNAAARGLNHLLGRPLGTPIDPAPDSALVFELTIGEDEAVASALARREELAEANAGIGGADAAVALATSRMLPSVAVALDYGVQGQDVRFDRDHDFWMASLVFSWELSGGGSDVARRAAARAGADRARVARRDLEESIRLEVRQAHAAAVVARTAIETAADRWAAARRTFELVRRRYEEGVATQIELIDARTQLTSAELNRTLTAHRYAVRWLELEHAAALRDID